MGAMNIRALSVGEYGAYAADITNAAVMDAIRSDPDVEYIEAEQQFYQTAIVQDQAPWGLRRSSQRVSSSTSTSEGPFQYYESMGTGVDIYVIDSGIRITHQEFGGRAIIGKNFSPDSASTDDLIGHGTHVAGTSIELQTIF
jgi:subtilisin family serine protease